MGKKTTRRGFDPNDFRWFSDEAVEKLKKAQDEIQWLLDRGYKFDTVLPFVSNHYLFSARQRLALQRSVSSSVKFEKRKKSMLPLETAKDGCIYIDGFNLIITLEVALSGSPVILGRDGVMRDLAGLRGTYRIIDKTDTALKLIGKSLNALSVQAAIFYLDAPVSNSGRLGRKIIECSYDWNIPVDVELVPNADTVLSKMNRVITSDAIILDSCTGWFNLARNHGFNPGSLCKTKNSNYRFGFTALTDIIKKYIFKIKKFHASTLHELKQYCNSEHLPEFLEMVETMERTQKYSNGEIIYNSCKRYIV